MSEHTSATWLMPPSSNSELRLCGLIIPGLPSVGMALGWFRGGDPNLNLTSDSGLIQNSAVPGIEGIPVMTKGARRCLPCPTRPTVVGRYRPTAAVKRRPPSTRPPGPSSPARASCPPPSATGRPGVAPGRQARRRGLRRHVDEYLLPSHLLEGGTLTWVAPPARPELFESSSGCRRRPAGAPALADTRAKVCITAASGANRRSR